MGSRLNSVGHKLKVTPGLSCPGPWKGAVWLGQCITKTPREGGERQGKEKRGGKEDLLTALRMPLRLSELLVGPGYPLNKHIKPSQGSLRMVGMSWQAVRASAVPQLSCRDWCHGPLHL